jgi:phosphotransferase system enzyme I (PtsI)
MEKNAAFSASVSAIRAAEGTSIISKEIHDGEQIAVDGSSGEVIISPDKERLSRYAGFSLQYQRSLDELRGIRDLPAETRDGRRVALKANLEIPEEAGQALRFGAEGIGLYRSEFLFLSPDKPTEEEEQYEAYRHMLEVMGELPVTIRTLDTGGDKLLPEFQTADDKNPLLGWRAIRVSLACPELFKVQLRALLRAGVSGSLRIMFPMISAMEELDQAIAMFEEAKAECRQRGQAYGDDIPLGVMIEVPSAALTAETLAEKAAFLSIGTNDLIQYTMAVDRGNERVSYLAQPFHPGLLKLLKMSIDGAHAKGISACMCGEMAGDPLATALLLGLGLDEFSMTAPAIPRVKRLIRSVNMKECRLLAQEALTCTSYRQVAQLVEGRFGGQ